MNDGLCSEQHCASECQGQGFAQGIIDRIRWTTEYTDGSVKVIELKIALVPLNFVLLGWGFLGKRKLGVIF